ncbi:MAG: hypothetical protein GX446_12340 [Chthonomonadales bacterium]|nr:hypothetical protein [Chthonomonadales bacterium]
MDKPGSERPGFDFGPTLRQRRLRVLSAFVLLLILTLVAVGVTQPFFRNAGSAEVRALAREAILARRSGREPTPQAERARRAAAVRVAVIGAYWSLCFLLSGVLLILAWLDVREIRRKLDDARRRLTGAGPVSPSRGGGQGPEHG